MTEAEKWWWQVWLDGIPPTARDDIVEWSSRNVRLPGSARCERFTPEITPWTTDPMRAITDDTVRMVTFVKPIQSGGSVVGEAALCYWLAHQVAKDCQYNWQNDAQADDRWDKRVFRILKACPSIQWPADRFSTMKGLVLFPWANLTMQGVHTARRVASDTVGLQINEEIHDEEGWKTGRLQQAHGRTTAQWDSKIINISNAGRKGSELHRCFEAGTQQHWESPCPECGKWHAMRIRWDDRRPELGGLRYDADGCRLEGGEYDYAKLSPTIRYQFPCGHELRDDVARRRALSLASRYGAPRNTGADGTHRSFTLQAVSVDYIAWLDLIKEKHLALRAQKFGDPEPWRKYLRERECIFIGADEWPMSGEKIAVTRALKKDKAGLDGRAFRFAALDYQRGEKRNGEGPHWWMVIRDVMDNGDSRLIYEGKLMSDEAAVEVLDTHEVEGRYTVCDSGDGTTTTKVYEFCLKYGFNAIKGEKWATFTHKDGSKRIYSPEKPLHAMMAIPPVAANEDEEPMFWCYSKSGIRDRLAWLRSSRLVKYETPEDVSEAYTLHQEAEELELIRDSTGSEVHVWRQRHERNDLFVCEAYIAMLMDMAGIIGAGAVGARDGKEATE